MGRATIEKISWGRKEEWGNMTRLYVVVVAYWMPVSVSPFVVFLFPLDTKACILIIVASLLYCLNVSQHLFLHVKAAQSERQAASLFKLSKERIKPQMLGFTALNNFLFLKPIWLRWQIKWVLRTIEPYVWTQSQIHRKVLRCQQPEPFGLEDSNSSLLILFVRW